MYNFPIGVLLDSFRDELPVALKKAAATGVSGLQMYATSGEFAPENLSAERRKEILKAVKGYGMEFSAICGDLGMGFIYPEKNPEFIERSKKIVDLALDLESNIITTHIGVVPADPNHPRYQIMQEACFKLGEYARSMDAYFAVETGPEIATTLKGFLDSLNTTGVAVNLDPANLIMVTGDDPVQAVYTLKDYIVHTHAKDGLKLGDCDPEVVYEIVQEPYQEVKPDDPYLETPLGEGAVDFPNYLKALEEIGYRGYLTVEREVGNKPEEDINLAVKFLKNTIAKAGN